MDWKKQTNNLTQEVQILHHWAISSADVWKTLCVQTKPVIYVIFDSICTAVTIPLDVLRRTWDEIEYRLEPWSDTVFTSRLGQDIRNIGDVLSHIKKYYVLFQMSQVLYPETREFFFYDPVHR
jgi:hypothetical protein